MDILQENIDELNAILKIKLTPEDYKGKYESSLKNYGKQVTMPGFRAGKVPMSLIKKKYGKSILAEEVNKVLSDSLQSYLKENKIDILGNPLPKEDGEQGDWDNPGEFEFIYELGLAPEFEIKLSGRNKFTYHKIDVDEELIGKQIDDLRRRHGKLETAEVSTENDMVIGTFQEIDSDGNILEAGINNSATISLEFIENAEVKASLVGKKVNDVVIVDANEVSKGEADMATMLGISKEDVANVVNKFNFTITEIKAMELAELNQELFDKLYGEGEVSSEEEMKAKIKEDLENLFVNDCDQLFQRNLRQSLVKKLALTLPDEFLKKWIIASNEKPVTVDQVNEEYDGYAQNLQWQLIQNRILAQQEIKVEGNEVVEFTKGLLVKQYAQYGLPAPEDEELSANAKNVLGNQEEARKIYEMVYDQKLLSYFKETVKIEEKLVSYDDFAKMVSEN